MKLNSEMSDFQNFRFGNKIAEKKGMLGFVQTRDQELSIALFKSIKLQLARKLELTYIFGK